MFVKFCDEELERCYDNDAIMAILSCDYICSCKEHFFVIKSNFCVFIVFVLVSVQWSFIAISLRKIYAFGIFSACLLLYSHLTYLSLYEERYYLWIGILCILSPMCRSIKNR